MNQDQYIIQLSFLSGVPPGFLFSLTTVTTLSSKDLLDFYQEKQRFPTVEEMYSVSKGMKI